MTPNCGETWSRARSGPKLLNAQKGVTFAMDYSLAQEFALPTGCWAARRCWSARSTP
ncbi:MAG TPA: hypothetical protein VEX11_12185 [Acetobacteraceae bacterium]|nr:hypothetical protein [Acetobacteraceae bacterium]